MCAAGALCPTAPCPHGQRLQAASPPTEGTAWAQLLGPSFSSSACCVKNTLGNNLWRPRPSFQGQDEGRGVREGHSEAEYEGKPKQEAKEEGEDGQCLEADNVSTKKVRPWLEAGLHVAPFPTRAGAPPSGGGAGLALCGGVWTGDIPCSNCQLRGRTRAAGTGLRMCLTEAPPRQAPVHRALCSPSARLGQLLCQGQGRA